MPKDSHLLLVLWWIILRVLVQLLNYSLTSFVPLSYLHNWVSGSEFLKCEVVHVLEENKKRFLYLFNQMAKCTVIKS